VTTLPKARSGSAPANEWVFDYDEYGDPTGVPVLLLHGFPQSRACWAGVATALAERGHRAIAVDQRGYSPGARPQGDTSYRLSELVADVVGLLDALAIPTAHLVGHDWGGLVAWHVAARHPQRLRSLSVLSTPHPAALADALRSDADQIARSAYLDVLQSSGAAEALLANGAERLHALLAPTGSAPAQVRLLAEPGRLDAALAWYRAGGWRDVAGPITVPTRYLWPSMDGTFGERAARATAQHVQAPYELNVLAGAGHWVAEQEPTRVVDALIPFLERSR
jgi:pimeloyl-ACP methyl ester carboxylesterase